MLPFSLLLACLSLANLCHGRGYSSASVRALDGASFELQVPAEKVTMAVFHAPWCGHCKKLEPDYEKAAQNLRGLVNFVSVDCDEEQNKRLCAQYGVQGFPTIKAFPGRKRKSPRDYTGHRTAKAIADYAVDMMPSYVKVLKGKSALSEVLEQPRTKPASLLVTSASNVTPLYKALSTDFKADMDFFAVKNAEELDELKAKLGVDKVPSISVWHGDDRPVTKHGGPLKYDALYAFYLDATRQNASSGGRDRSELQSKLDREIVRCCLDGVYSSLPAGCKPQTRAHLREWTVLAGFVLSRGEDLTCVSLGSGVKATPRAKLSSNGAVLHDCHAEILARRGLMVWLIRELEKGEDSHWLERSPGLAQARYRLRADSRLHLYISTLPCGDASTRLIADQQNPELAAILGGNVPSVWSHDLPASSVARGRAGYNHIGSLRTKPGRADSSPSFSMSCRPALFFSHPYDHQTLKTTSDKIASWLVHGLQGALLSRWLEPVVPSNLIFGCPAEYADSDGLAELRRALIDRVADRILTVPSIALTPVPFPHDRPQSSVPSKDISTSPLCISWIQGMGLEVIVNGLKQGASAKGRVNDLPHSAHSRLCKRQLFAQLQKLQRHWCTYYEAKHDRNHDGVLSYQARKKDLRESDFAGWLVSGVDLQNFALLQTEPS